MKRISSVDVMGGGYTLGGLVGRVGFLIRKSVPNVTEPNKNSHLDIGNISMFSDT